MIVNAFFICYIVAVGVLQLQEAGVTDIAVDACGDAEGELIF